MAKVLLHGSVTGKAESIAEVIAEEAERRGIDVTLHCMSQVGKEVRERSHQSTRRLTESVKFLV